MSILVFTLSRLALLLNVNRNQYCLFSSVSTLITLLFAEKIQKHLLVNKQIHILLWRTSLHPAWWQSIEESATRSKLCVVNHQHTPMWVSINKIHIWTLQHLLNFHWAHYCYKYCSKHKFSTIYLTIVSIRLYDKCVDLTTCKSHPFFLKKIRKIVR